MNSVDHIPQTLASHSRFAQEAQLNSQHGADMLKPDPRDTFYSNTFYSSESVCPSTHSTAVSLSVRLSETHSTAMSLSVRLSETLSTATLSTAVSLSVRLSETHSTAVNTFYSNDYVCLSVCLRQLLQHFYSSESVYLSVCPFTSPMIEPSRLENVLPACLYSPTYVVKDFPIARYQGLQFVYLSFVYPNDFTRLTHMEKENKCFYRESPIYLEKFGFYKYMKMDEEEDDRPFFFPNPDGPALLFPQSPLFLLYRGVSTKIMRPGGMGIGLVVTELSGTTSAKGAKNLAGLWLCLHSLLWGGGVVVIKVGGGPVPSHPSCSKTISPNYDSYFLEEEEGVDPEDEAHVVDTPPVRRVNSSQAARTSPTRPPPRRTTYPTPPHDGDDEGGAVGHRWKRPSHGRERSGGERRSRGGGGGSRGDYTLSHQQGEPEAPDEDSREQGGVVPGRSLSWIRTGPDELSRKGGAGVAGGGETPLKLSKSPLLFPQKSSLTALSNRAKQILSNSAHPGPTPDNPRANRERRKNDNKIYITRPRPANSRKGTTPRQPREVFPGVFLYQNGKTTKLVNLSTKPRSAPLWPPFQDRRAPLLGGNATRLSTLRKASTRVALSKRESPATPSRTSLLAAAPHRKIPLPAPTAAAANPKPPQTRPSENSPPGETRVTSYLRTSEITESRQQPEAEPDHDQEAGPEQEVEPDVEQEARPEQEEGGLSEYSYEEAEPRPGWAEEAIDWQRTFTVNSMDFELLRSDWNDLRCNVSGNLQLPESEVVDVLAQYMEKLNERNGGIYTLLRIINVEKRRDSARGNRYLVELELMERGKRVVRLSEYIYLLLHRGRLEEGPEIPTASPGPAPAPAHTTAAPPSSRAAPPRATTPWGTAYARPLLCQPVMLQWRRDVMVHFVVPGERGSRADCCCGDVTTAPLKNQARWVQQFISDMEQLHRETKDDNFSIIIVDFQSEDMDVERALRESKVPRGAEPAIISLQAQHCRPLSLTATKMKPSTLFYTPCVFVAVYEYLRREGNFERSAGLQIGVDTIEDSHSIVFLCDLHIHFPLNILESIRKHCVEGRLAFAPIVMRLGCGSSPREPDGYWEVNGFGLFGIYKSDFDKIGGMNTEEFKDRWGGEDWELLDRVLQNGLEVERLRLRNFFHYFHSKRGMWNAGVKKTPKGCLPDPHCAMDQEERKKNNHGGRFRHSARTAQALRRTLGGLFLVVGDGEPQEKDMRRTEIGPWFQRHAGGRTGQDQNSCHSHVRDEERIWTTSECPALYQGKLAQLLSVTFGTLRGQKPCACAFLEGRIKGNVADRFNGNTAPSRTGVKPADTAALQDWRLELNLQTLRPSGTGVKPADTAALWDWRLELNLQTLRPSRTGVKPADTAALQDWS
ncbi:hypothetical protein JZ751_029905 [Albula glossodonta]|uniref:Hexosyltransferase n=1 Tax=Albula glossodonta TaxID=121402 RepID=A0A8T2NDR4_9TELE|nr:hypothetical protein JZ751_029905 [Albula glossodonta]